MPAVSYTPPARRIGDHEWLHISGQTFARIGREIRAPLHILHRLFGSQINIVAHQTSPGRGQPRTYWFAAICPTRKGALEAFDRLREWYPAGRSPTGYAIHAAGGREPWKTDWRLLNPNGRNGHRRRPAK